MYFLDPSIKQPHSNMVPARFLGIAWNHGDTLIYYVRTEPRPGKRPQILIRSMVRSAEEALINESNEDAIEPVTFHIDYQPNPRLTNILLQGSTSARNNQSSLSSGENNS